MSTQSGTLVLPQDVILIGSQGWCLVGHMAALVYFCLICEPPYFILKSNSY